MSRFGDYLKIGVLSVLLGAGGVHAATSSTATVNPATTFNAASSPLGGINGCGLITGSHAYGTSTFTTSTAATYSFTVTAVGDPSLNDPFLAVYQGSFDPANPTVNLVGCNDDANSSLFSEFSATLNASTTYVMVATIYYDGAASGTVTFSTGIVPSLALANLSVALGATGQSMVATTNSSAAITYSIDDPTVATINPTTGALTLLTEGTATVTATLAPEADPGFYNGAVKTATLTVTAAPPAPPPVQPIPTLSDWAMIIMASLIALFAMGRIRRN